MCQTLEIVKKKSRIYKLLTVTQRFAIQINQIPEKFRF